MGKNWSVMIDFRLNNFVNLENRYLKTIAIIKKLKFTV
jgi:hypothetical protein